MSDTGGASSQRFEAIQPGQGSHRPFAEPKKLGSVYPASEKKFRPGHDIGERQESGAKGRRRVPGGFDLYGQPGLSGPLNDQVHLRSGLRPIKTESQIKAAI